MREKVIAIFDAGKTNKKLFLFNQEYKIVYEKSARLNEIEDEDGFPCENLESLRLSVFDSLNEIFKLKEFEVTAVNFSAYGASFVLLGEDGNPVCPLYNYLKPYPEELLMSFYSKYGGEEKFGIETASPSLGSLNSGLQLYRLKMEQPELFNRVKYALHLPQYLSFLLTGKYFTDLTSIGCHTALWDFENNDYHNWVYAEDISSKFAPVYPGNAVVTSSYNGQTFAAGVGLHDSSAAIIPYLMSFTEPFILISTGTWAISMNPFDEKPLLAEDLKNDCLKYLQFRGKPVKAARLFSGYEYEQQIKRIANFFNIDVFKYRTIKFDAAIVSLLEKKQLVAAVPFEHRDLTLFTNDIEAYYQLIIDLVERQRISTGYVLKDTKIKRIFVDGGFSKNVVYMNLLAAAFPKMEVFAASMAQATAIGSALAIHDSWNSRALPNDLIELKYYATNHTSFV